MKTGWRIGRIFGIDIVIDSSWILIFILFSWSMAGGYFPRQYPHWSKGLAWAMGVLTSLFVFVSVLIHELAHSLVAIRQGEKVKSITLFLLGGVSQISGEPKAPLQEFRMAFVGPLTSFVLAGIFFGISILLGPVSVPLHASALYLAVINVGLGVFNLLPGFPLDGGRVFRSIVWKITGDIKKATRAASLSGQAFAFLFIFLGLFRFIKGDLGGLWFVLIGWFLHSASVRGYDQVAIQSAMRGLNAGNLMAREFETVHPGLTVEKLVNEHILAGRGRIFLVTDLGGDLKGIVCLEDVKATPRNSWPSATVGEIMTPRDRLQAVTPEADGNEILARLAAGDVHEIPVMDGGKLVGIICRTDLLRELQMRSDLGL
jgi:Zn-dependent protease/CBS domain-containing protein